MGKFLSIGILLLAFSFSLLACFGEAEAQVSSSAFDPNCYQPRLGVASEIDSIYGSKDQQHLGEYMAAFPPSKDFPLGSVAITGLPNTPPFLSFVPQGSSFNLHNLQANLKNSNLKFNYPYSFGPFHDRQHEDILLNGGGGSRIYWADDNGDYDSSKYTDLNSSVIGVFGNDVNPASYAAFLTADSVYDIIKIVRVDDTPYVSNTKIILMLYQGGQHLYNKRKIAYEDSGYVFAGFDKAIRFEQARFLQGDFRGIGREDLITSDDSGNWFFYKNDPPFSMASFTDALYNDTLFTAWENKSEYTPGTDNIIFDALVTELLPHPFDKAKDIMIRGQFHNSTQRRDHIKSVIRGGPDFGKERILLSNSEYIFHNPWYYDHQFQEIVLPKMFEDAGDISGAGIKTLIAMDGEPGFSSQFFFNTGKAISDKAVAYYSYLTQGIIGSVVPLVADGDHYEDLLLSDPNLSMEDDVSLGKFDIGTIHLLHGSSKIPVHLNPKYSVEERNAVDAAPWHITANPNPCDEKIVLTFDNCTTSRMKIQVCTTDGRIVQEEETPAVDGLQQYALFLPSLSPGMYVVRLSCPALGWTGSVNIVKTGMVQGSGNFDLKKMVGR